jgi:predicted acylesterase/phospholipase RssA
MKKLRRGVLAFHARRRGRTACWPAFQKLTAAAGLALLVAGCASSLARLPVPEPLVDQATVPEFKDIRFWGDAPPGDLDRIASSAGKDRQRYAVGHAQHGQRFLAISGGGSDGAFGAGLLVGWSASGTRPEFDVVTGVSTGALIAPFAFLGPLHDPALEALYTQYSTAELLKPKVISGLLGGTAIADNRPFEALIAHYVTAEIMASVAREHHKGRRLLVGTTNMDAQRSVIWDLGAIASSGRPDALPLFRRVLIASASIPGAFPPIRIQVRAKGGRYDEMHLDGGITSQVFFLPSKGDGEQTPAAADDELYVIRNGQIGPEYLVIENGVTPIVGRSISTLVKSQANSELFSLYSRAQRYQITFHLAYIPSSFDVVSKETFDLAYMNALFKLGYGLARDGYPWSGRPPGFQ